MGMRPTRQGLCRRPRIVSSVAMTENGARVGKVNYSFLAHIPLSYVRIRSAPRELRFTSHESGIRLD